MQMIFLDRFIHQYISVTIKYQMSPYLSNPYYSKSGRYIDYISAYYIFNGILLLYI